MEDYDVIVVGAGNAALSAAVSAHENGARRVLVLEKAPRDMRGGNTHWAGAVLRIAFDDPHDLAPLRRRHQSPLLECGASRFDRLFIAFATRANDRRQRLTAGRVQRHDFLPARELCTGGRIVEAADQDRAPRRGPVRRAPGGIVVERCTHSVEGPA